MFPEVFFQIVVTLTRQFFLIFHVGLITIRILLQILYVVVKLLQDLYTCFVLCNELINEFTGINRNLLKDVDQSLANIRTFDNGFLIGFVHHLQLLLLVIGNLRIGAFSLTGLQFQESVRLHRQRTLHRSEENLDGRPDER